MANIHPLVPEDISRRADLTAAWRRSFVRSVTASVLGYIHKTNPEEILHEAWPDDRTAGVMLQQRGAVSPIRVGDFSGSSITQVMVLADDTALAEILDLALKVNLKGVAQLRLSAPTNVSQAVFVEEGFPIPVAQGVFPDMLIDMVKKLAMIAPLTNELENYSAPTASVVISRLIKISVGNGGAKVLLSTDPTTAAAPAGILNGIPPIAAGASPSEDIKALLAAISAANISTRSVALIVAPDLAASLETQPWPLFKRKVIEANMLAPGTAIALAVDGFAVGGEGTPVVDVGKSATLHMADPAAQIVGPDGTVAGPTVSMFATDSFALRCVCRLTWAVAPGAVAWIQNAVW
jgi:hypothetical protein